ncbi:SDR family oxidoreductase [Cystobacter ferrugineus]|uniref:NAD(P)-dependent oxidoreductase n=1 Tax=Cystobacter ferrugineus TaxID=83449 RepID=A0A1L9B2J2_9BACT|nr:SDR family oxidoreductase [Cystobacter ferrugineus]OJH36450.1 NAD(P)-dependent oxidoreductase [Cystobacter ferrugineus]
MFLVTGATGKLGRHVIEGLLKKVPAGEIIAAVRNPQKAAELAARGVQVRPADYSRSETLDAAFAGATRVLLISSSEVGQRIAQHRAVVEAARKAGVRLLVYTSILRADSSGLALAAEHKATEQLIRDSGIPFVFLRNGWYFENYTENLAPALEHGALLGSSGEGRISAASRADYAAAAVEVLTGTGHDNRVYELAGDTAFTLSELATEVSRQSGRNVVYKDLPPAQYQGALESAGVPGAFAGILVNSSEKAGRGELNDVSGVLSRLIGRPTTRLADAVAAAVRK